MTDPKLPRYTKEEVAAILSRALDQRQQGEGRISHDELLETARDIGITTSQMEAAIAAETRIRAEKAVAEAKLDAERRKAKIVFAQHAAAFVVAGVGLAAIDLKLTGGVWFYWVLLAWSVALALHAARVFSPRSPAPAEDESSSSSSSSKPRDADTLPGR